MSKQNKLVLIVSVGLLTTIISFIVSYRIEQKRVQIIFEKAAVERTALIIQSIEMTELVTESMRNLFLVTEDISYPNFQKFINSFNKKMIGIQSLEWVPRIKHSDKENFITQAKNTLSIDYKILELNADHNLISANEREEYFPVYYLEPIKGNEESLGFDLASNKERNAALKNSAEKNRFVASERIILVQGEKNEIGIRLFEPVIRNLSESETENKKLENLIGFVGGVFKPEKIVENSISVLQKTDIDIYLLDESAPKENQLLYFHKSRFSQNNEQTNFDEAEIKFHQKIQYGGRTWSITCIPTQNFFDVNEAYIPHLISLIFFFLTAFFSFYYFRHSQEKERIKNIVEKRTKELNESKQRLDLAINVAELGLWDWNIKTGNLYNNEKFATMLEFKENDIEPFFENWKKLIHPDDEDEVLDILNQHLEGYTPNFSAELRLGTKSGNWKWIQTLGKVVERNENGKPERAIGINIDITERKYIQQKLIKYSQKLEKQNIEKSKIFSIISHDLKSPLVAINGFSELLVTDIDTLDLSEIKKYCIYIYQSSTSLNSILEGLAEWGRLQLGQITFSPKSYQLNKQIEKVINQEKINALNKEIEIQNNFNGNFKIFADEIMIETCMRNLLSNAIKFTPHKGKIYINAEMKDDKIVTFSVTDTGVGIPESNLKNMFKDSYHISTNGTSGEKGTGLGLGICKEFVERNGGKIWVESIENFGTTFYFTLRTEDSLDYFRNL
ncbi:MAG: CHASE domain-containing protein [Ignavibacteriae bacterium]|nr:CHASE domain-containing protein [Ignavibacteriota bacterium]